MTRKTSSSTTQPSVYKRWGFHKELGEALQGQYDRVKIERKASLIIIDGGVGEGKTTLGVRCGDFVNHIDGKPAIDITAKTQLSMGGEEFIEKLLICQKRKLPVVVYDEAGDFNKRGSLSRFNAAINRVFETFRGFQVIVILILPSFKVLDNSIFDKNIPRLLLHCSGRTTKIGYARAYSLPKMMFVRRTMEKITIKASAFNSQTPNFHIHFKDLTPKRSAELDKISTESKIAELEKQFKKVSDGLMSYDDIAKQYNRSTMWVRHKVSALGIKESKMIGNKKYFDSSILETIG